jgi:adenosine deaminase
MFHTDIGKEYVDFCGQNGYPPEVAKQLVRNGVDATWLDDAEKAALRAQFDGEIAELDAALDLATVPAADTTPGTTARPAAEPAEEPV